MLSNFCFIDGNEYDSALSQDVLRILNYLLTWSLKDGVPKVFCCLLVSHLPLFSGGCGELGVRVECLRMRIEAVYREQMLREFVPVLNLDDPKWPVVASADLYNWPDSQNSGVRFCWWQISVRFCFVLLCTFFSCWKSVTQSYWV